MIVVGLLALILAFDVAHAGEIVALPNEEPSLVLQEPNECLQGNSYCAVRTSERRKFKWIEKSATLTMDWQTLLLRLEPGVFRLISGNLWVSPQKGQSEILTVETEAAQFSSRYEFWIRREESQILILSVRGPVEIRLRGDSQVYVLESGFQNWISRVDRRGRAQMGIPRAIDIESHIEVWARLFPGSRTEFRAALEEWRPIWLNAVGLSSEIHQELVHHRELAMAREHRSKKAQAEARASENQRLRELFRQKVLLE